MAAAASRPQIPGTPRVISPSPTPSESSDYFPPSTRSMTKRKPRPSSATIDEDEEATSSDSEGLARARSRSRSRDDTLRRRRLSGLSMTEPKPANGRPTRPNKKRSAQQLAVVDEDTNGNGHLSPASAVGEYWRSFSRSPSPLGLIPIHREWRSFVHRHEIPRKLLHISIGFLTLFLYSTGISVTLIPPPLLTLLIPIALTDLIRHNHPAFNRFYIRCLGAFMRETEAHEKYNGVIWYLLGTWTVLRFFPKDVGVCSVLLLSWCDTAASTFGRLYGRYTPRIRRGKSLAGSLAAAVVGVGTAVLWWGWVAPYFERSGVADNTGVDAFAFKGALTLPVQMREVLGWTAQQAKIQGPAALGVMSLWAGFVASASEAVDIFGWDDNVTIPVLCGVGLWGFLKVFGDA